MRRCLLGLGAIFACGCGGADFNIPNDGGGDGPGPFDSGGDGGGGDACVAVPEICGDMKDNDCDGVADNGCKSLGTYVSGATGVDTNPGTQTSPVKTIGQGIKNAIAIGGKLTVYVGNSHYPEKVTLVEGITLEGGYHCDTMLCDWARNPSMFDTAILNQDFEGVLAPANITRATRIDGFRIQGMNGMPQNNPGSACIVVLGSPTITGNRINGGDITGGSQWYSQRTIGVAILAPISDPAGPLVENNDIQGGQSGNYATIGVMFDAVGNPPMGAATSSGMVRNNRIRGGNGANTNGIAAWSSAGQAAVVGNSILSGGGMGGVAQNSWGIVVGGTLLVDGNLINTDQNAVGGCGSNWCGGLASYSSTSTIVNNVIYGNKSSMSTAVLLAEAEKPAGIVVLNSNVLDGAGLGIQGNLTRSAALVLRISFGTNAKLGRTRNNVMQGGINLFRYGVWEEQVANKTNKPEFLEFNNFFFPPLQGRTDSYWHQWSGTAATDTLVVPAMNQSGDPLLDTTWHLGNGSPCIDKGTMTEAPAKDRDGNNRPMGQGFDIGADEK